MKEYVHPERDRYTLQILDGCVWFENFIDLHISHCDDLTYEQIIEKLKSLDPNYFEQYPNARVRLLLHRTYIERKKGKEKEEQFFVIQKSSVREPREFTDEELKKFEYFDSAQKRILEDINCK